MDLVLELIDHAERRSALREHLGKIRTTCALFDAPRYARALDRAYAHMYQQAIDGQRTQSFDVAPE
jgi:predicted O-linked N-acetylglucosamine transferase (SPINDLY family)